MIDFGKRTEVGTRELILELLEFVDDVVDELGSRKAIDNVYKILENGNGADRQLKVFEKTGDIKSVVDYITDQTLEGV
jgi:carboxylate-amine ligase